MAACAQPGFVLLALLAAWALMLAAVDIRWRRVPNLALLPVLLMLVVAGVLNYGSGCWPEPGSSGVGAVLALAMWLPGYAVGQVGAGDVKCAFVFSAVLGGVEALEANLLGLLVLGLMAATAMVRGRRAARLPVVPALALGFLIELAGGPWLLGGA